MGSRAERVRTAVGTRCCCRLVVGYWYLLRWSVYSVVRTLGNGVEERMAAPRISAVGLRLCLSLFECRL